MFKNLDGDDVVTIVFVVCGALVLVAYAIFD